MPKSKFYETKMCGMFCKPNKKATDTVRTIHTPFAAVDTEEKPVINTPQTEEKYAEFVSIPEPEVIETIPEANTNFIVEKKLSDLIEIDRDCSMQLDDMSDVEKHGVEEVPEPINDDQPAPSSLQNIIDEVVELDHMQAREHRLPSIILDTEQPDFSKKDEDPVSPSTAAFDERSYGRDSDSTDIMQIPKSDESLPIIESTEDTILKDERVPAAMDIVEKTIDEEQNKQPSPVPKNSTWLFKCCNATPTDSECVIKVVSA